MPEVLPIPPDPLPNDAVPSPTDLAFGTAPTTGGRMAFRDIKRQLSAEELASPGVQKLILEMLSEVEDQRDDLQEFQERFHEKDKQCAVLEEKLKSNKLNEVMFGVGVGLGGTIIGLAPVFWPNSTLETFLALIVGVLLAGGATAARVYYK